jgi:hypothetical protein
MMNKPAWFFGTTSVLLAGLFLRQPAAAPAAAPQATPDAVLQEQLTQARAERDRLETVVSSLRTAPANAVLPSPPTAAPPFALQTLPPTRFEFSPSNRRASLRLHNGKIFRELGLSDAQVESLLDVLLAQQTRSAEAMKNGTPFAGADPEARARNRAEVAAVIGNERAEQLEDWQGRAQARFELRRMRDQLEDSGEPLSDAQLKRIGELVQAQPPSLAPPRQKDETPEAFTERYKAWRNDNREQLRKQVSTVLEPRQLARYDEMDAVSREFEKSLPIRGPMLQAPPSAGQAAPPAPR